MIKNNVRVRFAPSPSGNLHVGGLRTALFNWLFARHHDGLFLMRIEDTDNQRSKREYTDAIIQAFRWVDIHADKPIFMQSERFALYQNVAQKLLHEGKAYKCYCVSDDMIKGSGDKVFFKYNGRCRSAADKNQPYVVRFKLPEIQEIAFHDMIRGPVHFERDQLDDFIIVRSDGSPIYNFVVVVDDAAMDISHVIRGEDHISNTPKQILLYQACGYTVPQFAHIPMILGASGDRLSKRDGATSVLEYKDAGYLPDALINYLVRLGWAHGDQEIFTREEMIKYFTLEAVGKKNAIFDKEKLNWVNSTYIKNMSNDELLRYIEKEMDPRFSYTCASWDQATLLNAIGLYKERVVTVKELIQEVYFLYHGPIVYVQEDIDLWIGLQTKEQLARIVQLLQAVEYFSSEACGKVIKDAAKDLGIKFVVIAQPIRIALLGKSSGPGIFELLSVLGKKESIDRIQRLRQHE